MLKYYNDQELPVLTVDWSAAGEDFSTGWTFTVKLARTSARATNVLNKTTGITSTATTVTIAWSTSDWAGLEASTSGTDYLVYVYARRNSDSKDLEFRPGNPIQLRLYAAVGTSAVSPTSWPITVTAASVTLADTGGYFTATDVEGALAEVFATPSTTARRVVELATDAEALARTDTQRAVTPANLSQFLPLSVNSLMRSLPSSAIAQTVPRWAINTSAGALLATGRMNLYRIWLPAGPVSTITFVSGGTGATTPTNQWFALYDANRNRLAVTADDTSTAWGANSAKTLTISGGYTVPSEGDYYVGIMVAATTPPQLAASVGSGAVNALTPTAGGFDATNTGLTTPATAPAVAAAISASAGISYAYVS